MNRRRVVVTGLGAVTPLGDSVADFWQRLVAGERGIKPITKFDPTGLRNETAGEVSSCEFHCQEFGLTDPPDEATQFLLSAAHQAITDADLDGEQLTDTGMVLATNFGGAMSWERFVDGMIRETPQPHHFTEFRFDSAVAHLRDCWTLNGPSSLLSIACASGTAAVGYAFDLIRSGQVDIMLAAGHDALAPSHLAGLSVLRTITAEDIRPFSKNRSGTLFGEGAGAVILEEYDSAQERGARLYCEVAGWAQNNNAYHITAPDKGGAGISRVLDAALADAGVDSMAIDYINAHGTGTEYHDPAETQAIKTILSDYAYEIGVSSIKGAIGHLMGAAGLVEAIATVKALQDQVMPPTVNYEEPDPECDLDYVPNEARPSSISCAATISAGIGGSNACVILRTARATDPTNEV